MRRPAWKILAIAATVALAPAGAAALWIRSAADRRFAAMEDKVRALEAEALAPDPTPRFGKVPGNAWDDYVPALREASKINPGHKLIGVVDRTQNADEAFGRAALSAHGPAVDLIVSGSRRAACIPPGRSALRALWQWETAIRLGILKSRALQAEGRIDDAAETLLALCQFARDLSVTGMAVAFGFPYPALELALQELKDLIGTARRAELLAEIDLRLAHLDDAFPLPEKLRRQQAQLVSEINTHLDNPKFGAVILSWRFGFSPRLLRASAFERWEHWFDRSVPADRLPWPEAQALIATIREDIDHTRFMDDQDLPSSFLPDGAIGRSARTHLRLLRVIVHYRATGEDLDLEDPFGTRLRRSFDPARLKAWSVGQDGVDQGGQGGWMSRPVEDIVLEVPR